MVTTPCRSTYCAVPRNRTDTQHDELCLFVSISSVAKRYKGDVPGWTWGGSHDLVTRPRHRHRRGLSLRPYAQRYIPDRGATSYGGQAKLWGLMKLGRQVSWHHCSELNQVTGWDNGPILRLKNTIRD